MMRCPLALPDLHRHLGFLLNDVARLLRKRLEQRTRALGLTRAQWSVLAHIARHEGINQAALAEILEIEPITLARILDRLESMGYIERRSHPEDRRARLPHLTDKARPALEQLFALGAETREEALAGVSAADRERLIELLLRMKSNLCTRVSTPGADHNSSHVHHG